MKVLFSVFSCFSLLAMMAPVQAAEYIRPCRIWIFDPDVRGYVCNSVSMSRQFVELWEHQEALERIEALEDRVARLEGGDEDLVQE